jgi:hypothetical protein
MRSIHNIVHFYVVAGGTSSNMEGNYEYIEQTVADSRQWVVLQLAGLVKVLTTFYRKNVACNEMFTRASDLTGTCECGNEPSGSVKCG